METSLSLLDRLRLPDDPHSWARFVEIYEPLLKRWLARFQVQDADQEDLVQEVLSAVVRDLPRFEHNGRRGALRAWLRQVLVNRLQYFFRNKRRHPTATGTSQFVLELAELADEHSSLSRMWDHQHDQHVLAHLLAIVEQRFTAKSWQAFRQVVFEGESAVAVARSLAMSPNAVLIAKSRVLRTLREEARGLLDEARLSPSRVEKKCDFE